MSFSSRPIGSAKPKRQFPWRATLGFGLMIAKPLWSLGVKMYERRQQAKAMKRIVALSAAGVVVVVIALLAFSLAVKVGMVSVPNIIEQSGMPISVGENGHTNILLLGQGNEEHDGIDLTDTIMVASLDPEHTQTTVLFSLPRDLMFLHTENMGERKKLNELWRDYRITKQRDGMSREEAGIASLDELRKEIGNAIGIPIHHAIKVDFTAFEKIIDLIGGIDITVPEVIHDTEYPGPNYSYQTFHIDAGFQHIDGATALKYARTRSTTSDFERSARQQAIIKEAANQAKESGILKNPMKIYDLLTILSEHLESDLNARQFITLSSLAKKLDPDRVVTMQMNNVNGLYGDQIYKGGILYSPPRDLFGGASVLLPVSMPEFPVTWKQVQMLGSLIFNHRDIYAANPRIAIFNGSAREGSASLLYRELTKVGFEVVEVTNLPGNRDTAPDQTVIMNWAESSEPAALFFSDLFSMPLSDDNALRERLAQAEHGDMSIILGQDYDFQYLQNLVPASL